MTPIPRFSPFPVLALALALAAILLPAGAPAGTSAARPRPAEEVTAIVNVSIFDGEKPAGIGNVIVTGGRIVACGPGAAVPPGAIVIDGTGKTLLPGLIDAHVHTFGPEPLRQALVFGLTSVVDMFMDETMMRDIQKAQAEGRAYDQAHLVSPGTLATVAGGHGTQFGLPIPVLTSPADAAPFVRARVAAGADFIKIIRDDGSTYGLKRPTLTSEEVAALIRAAHAAGRKAVIHAATLAFAREALADGVDGLAHLYFDDADDPDFGRRAARAKAFVIPTLSILRTMSGNPDTESLIADPDLAPYYKPADLQGLKTGTSFTTGRAAYAAAERALGRLKAAGVPILAGTDAPNPSTVFGPSLHRELSLLVAAGLTPIEALRSATSVPASVFGLAGRGRLEAGAIADLLLVAGDPTVDVAATRRIVAVWKEGRRGDRTAYAAAAAAERAGAERAKSGPPAGLPADGLISAFDGDAVEASFGAGWVVSTDAMLQGKSQAAMRIVAGGAEGSRGALEISGEIRPGGMSKWAGAMFVPGTSMMAPVNLSSRRAVRFWAKGDPRPCAVELFAQVLGFRPAIRVFTPTPEWREYVFPFSDFKLDGAGIMAVFIGAVNEDGPFRLTIDGVRLE